MSNHRKTAGTTPSPEPLLVTTAVAAALLSVSTYEIRRLVRKGLLVHRKISKTNWLINVTSLRKFAGAV